MPLVKDLVRKEGQGASPPDISSRLSATGILR